MSIGNFPEVSSQRILVGILFLLVTRLGVVKAGASASPSRLRSRPSSEGGMIRLETLIELRFLNSNFSSSKFSIRAFRAYPLIEIRQTVPCRAIQGNIISVSSTLPPS